MNLDFFDLHCDTLIPMMKKGSDLCDQTNQFSIKDSPVLSRRCQTLAIFTFDDLKGAAAREHFEENYRYVRHLEETQHALFEIARCAADIERINAAGKHAVFLSVENGGMLGGDIRFLDRMAECGIKMITLAWNEPNGIASGHTTDEGFTPFGRDVVRRMEELGIVVDVSHLNDRGFDELCEFAEKPFIATHSDCRSICHHHRNLTDAQIRELIRRGGLLGLCGIKAFLSDNGSGTREDLFRHVDHVLELGGGDILACGSDFDGAVEIDESLLGPERFAQAAEYFLKKGLSETVIKNMFFDNALRFFS